jgi:hypothetical protein
MYPCFDGYAIVRVYAGLCYTISKRGGASFNIIERLQEVFYENICMQKLGE